MLLHEVLLKARRHPNNDGKTMQILIAHTSKTGNTAQVATYLAHALEARGSRVTSVNLQDASALVDYSGAEISLSIGDWDVDGSFGDIEI